MPFNALTNATYIILYHVMSAQFLVWGRKRERKEEVNCDCELNRSLVFRAVGEVKPGKERPRYFALVALFVALGFTFVFLLHIAFALFL